MKSRFILSLILLLLIKNIYAQPTPLVVVSIKPIHSIVSSLMDGIAKPKLLLKSNVSAHTFHLKPSQISSVENAKLVITISDEFEIGLRKVLKNLDESSHFQIISLHNLNTHRYRADKIYDNNHQEEHNQEVLTNDLHLWLDIDNMKKISQHISSLLIVIDPGNEDKYKQNFKELISNFDALQIEIKNQMHPFSGKHYATYSDTIQYFEKKYNLGRPIIVTPYHGARLSINRTLAAKNTIKDLNVSCLIYGPDVRKSQISVLSEGLNINAYKIDALGQKLTPGPEQYFELIKRISNQTSSCLK